MAIYGNIENVDAVLLATVTAEAIHIKGTDGKDGADGKDGTDGITPHIGDNGNWFLGTTDTGKPSRGAQGVKGDKGDKGDDGAPGTKGDAGTPGKDGTSVTVASVSESTADGGTNTVTFSDGSALKVKNGSKGSAGADGKDGAPGAPGKDGADGHTPVKGTDYWTASDKAEVVAAAAAAVDLTSYAKKTEVPTKTSQLTNDSCYLTLATLPKYGGESE